MRSVDLEATTGDGGENHGLPVNGRDSGEGHGTVGEPDLVDGVTRFRNTRPHLGGGPGEDELRCRQHSGSQDETPQK